MKEKKERKYRWTNVPMPKCRLCKQGKLHTEAQHKLSVRRYNESHGMFDGFVIRVSSWG